MSEIILPKSFNPQEVAITVSTYYPGWSPDTSMDTANTVQVRGTLGLEFIQTASRLGFEVVVSDSGSDKRWVDAIPNNVRVIKFPKPVMSPGKKEAIRIASQIPGVKHIFRSEAEKVDALNHIPDHIKSLYTYNAAIAVGQRRDQEFRGSYPKYAYDSEIKFARTYAIILRRAGLLARGEELDLYSGFIGFRNEQHVVDLFMQRYQYTGSRESKIRQCINENGWSNSQVFPIVVALHLNHLGIRVPNFKVVGVEIPFRYSDIQRQNEEHPANKSQFMEKRVIQRLGGLAEGILLVNKLCGDPVADNQLKLIEL